ncbi:hypothetical protein ACTI_65060 [Actinoplanes sp. OR16]|uniref:hypothetical protein n=1 Tax=Actinoplanes sp. OR16 TaxID=946334 RepID=UPI000F6FDFDA|nr:hypothetical protein [Actinoplanes sp. OR16]BBH69821.1 hypothetical protein ACTI_65060 [Actinoplanes sp. OR16]
MLGGLVQAGSKALGGDRFSLVGLLPTTLLVGWVAFLTVSGLYRGDRVDLSGIVATVGKSAGWAVFAVFGIFVIAVLLRPLQISLVWMLEGYWDRNPVLKWLEPVAVEWHLRRRHSAEVIANDGVGDPPAGRHLQSVIEDHQRLRAWGIRRARAEERISRYPEDRVAQEIDDPGPLGVEPADEIRLMPTMLGNALRKGEDDAGDRYGLDFPAIAPRLYPHLSDKISKEIARNLDVMETGAALTVVFLLSAACSVPLLWRGDLWAAAVPVALVLALLAYLGTLRTAREHGLLLSAAVDLHRFDMLAKLRYRLPETVDEEWRLNRALSAFLGADSDKAYLIMARYRYAHVPDPTTAVASPVAGDAEGQAAPAG